MPGFSGASLEAASILPGRRDGGIEHHRVSAHVSCRGTISECGPRYHYDLTGAIPVKHPTATHERRTNATLQLLEDAKEGIDRATGRAGGRLIDRDHEEPVIPPLASAGQRFAVRFPAGKVGIDRVEQLRRAFTGNSVRCGEDPESGIVRQLGKCGDRHGGRGVSRLSVERLLNGSGDTVPNGIGSSQRRQELSFQRPFSIP